MPMLHAIKMALNIDHTYSSKIWALINLNQVLQRAAIGDELHRASIVKPIFP
ncbi:MAG TPA: hypothetical protein VIZ65_11795 [Cellvibrionaceae bacterium]